MEELVTFHFYIHLETINNERCENIEKYEIFFAKSLGSQKRLFLMNLTGGKNNSST